MDNISNEQVVDLPVDSPVESLAFDLSFPPSVSVASASDQLDTVGDADHLSATLAHLAGVRAAADHRILTTASQLAEECEETYLIRQAEQRGQRESTAEELADAANATGPADRYGPTGTEEVLAYLGAAMNVTPTAARRLIHTGHALRYRLPLTGTMLAAGRIDKTRFEAAVAATELVSEDLIGDLDQRLSAEITARPAMSVRRFTTMVDRLIALIDPEALALRRENVSRDRKVTVRPDRRVPGQSRVNGQLTTERGAQLDAALNTLAASVHPDDPRTKAQRRADALVGMATGDGLQCECAPCVQARRAAAADPAADPTPLPVGPVIRGHFHIIANLSSLLGVDNDPAYIDGHGLIDAATARELLAEAKRSYIHSGIHTGTRSRTAGYRPSGRLDDLIRCGELGCAFPGCDNPVFAGDLDHADEYDHHDPAAGGATSRANLIPLCRLHHRIKTFTDWRDHRDQQGLIAMTSPAGMVTIGNGFTGTDLFPDLRTPPQSPPAPQSPAPPGNRTGHACLRDRAGRERNRLRRLKQRREADEPEPPY